MGRQLPARLGRGPESGKTLAHSHVIDVAPNELHRDFREWRSQASVLQLSGTYGDSLLAKVPKM